MNTNIVSIKIGNLRFLQTSSVFIALKPHPDVDYEFQIFHGGLIVGTGWIECAEVRFNTGEQMPNGVWEETVETIKAALPELFPAKIEQFEEIDLDRPTRAQLLRSVGFAAVGTQDWREAV